VVDEKIVAIGDDLKKHHSFDELIDAHRLLVFPGGIDPHTHMDLPVMGTHSSDDFETGTISALHGGTTSIIDFANQEKGGTLNDALDIWKAKASGKAISDYGFHLTITDLNERTKKEIPAIFKSGITSFKTFTAYRGSLMIDDKMMGEIMREIKALGGLVTVHAEDADTIEDKIREYKNAGLLTPKYHALSHPISAEVKAASRVMDLAYQNESGLYIVHTSAGDTLKAIQKNFDRRQRVFVETCTQYLLLDDSVYDQPGFESAKYVMSPPIRSIDDCKDLWYALRAGLVHSVATDHCPFHYKGQKDAGDGDFTKIPNGAPGVENRMELIYSEGVDKGRITLEKFVEVTSTYAARIFGMKNKGALDIGKDADIVLFDPSALHTISSSSSKQNVDYNLYEGQTVTGKVITVLRRGKVVVRNGKADQMEKGTGQFIKRDKFNFSL
jgi:dihydropyrimidinase